MSAKGSLNNEEKIIENGLAERLNGEELKCRTEYQEDMQSDSELNLGQLPEKELREGSTSVTDVNGGSPIVDDCDRPPAGDIEARSEDKVWYDIRLPDDKLWYAIRQPEKDVKLTRNQGSTPVTDVSGGSPIVDDCDRPPAGDIESRSEDKVWYDIRLPDNNKVWYDIRLPGKDVKLTRNQESTPTSWQIYRLMHNYGPQRVPDDIRSVIWAATKADLQEMISDGLIPQDSMDSLGIDPRSHEHFMNCVTEIREKIWEQDLRTALSILRGARRIFSASNDIDLRHVFCGPPIEVLANIYYDGIGVLPKNQMTEDPFHHSLSSDRLTDEHV